MHPSIPPSDVTFFVTQQPMYGSLEIDQGSGDVKDEPKAKVEAFEQSSINDNKLRYFQVGFVFS